MQATKPWRRRSICRCSNRPVLRQVNTVGQEATQIPVLVAGTGHGLRVLVPALRANGFVVVGLVGVNPDRTRRRADSNAVPQAFTDLDTAITATGAAAVAIATPPHTHAPLVHTALSRRCHVLCEKPFAKDAQEARAMLAAAEHAGVVHVIGNQLRMRPERVMVARAIAQGLIGEPRLISITQYTGLVASPDVKWPPTWWFDNQAGGGWLGASGSHMIDMVRTWLGEFASLSAALPIVSDREGVAEDSYLLRFRMESDVEGVLMQTGAAWGEFASMTRVAGTSGTLSMEDGAVRLSNRNGTRELPIPPELALTPEAPSDDPRKMYLHIELPPARRLCQAWHAAITGKAPGAVSVATFADGVACMQVIDAIRASAAAGGVLVAISHR
jgi:predicted dehydrogenase